MNTKNAIENPSTTRPTAPTRRASLVSCASRLTRDSFLPEELPGIPLEIADQLAQVTVDIVAREQCTRSALACAEVRHHAVNVVDEAAGLACGGCSLVGRADRLVD